MQIDLHYHGTYALARAAGLKVDAASIIATASQYVDDSTHAAIEPHPDGARIRAEVTAHHPFYDLRVNRDLDDQRDVWVPFHFFPGGEGTTLSQKLICRKDSMLVREMVQHHTRLSDAPFILELMGITAHTYADTFAHYGFSGVSSRVNKVAKKSIEPYSDVPPTVREYFGKRIALFLAKNGRQGGLIRNFRAGIAGLSTRLTGALGHGAVAVFPDQPYLRWRFRYLYPELRNEGVSERDNPETYMEACKTLHSMFRKFANRRSDLADSRSRRDFSDIKPRLRSLIELDQRSRNRVTAWRAAAKDNELYRGPHPEIPAYGGNHWERARKKLPSLRQSHAAVNIPVYRFFQAAAVHREYVQRELLPRNGIVVV